MTGMSLAGGAAHPAGPVDDQHAGSLPIGARLGEFEVIGYIAEGGFGIVYRAMDHSLGREVALKEYMPSALAARTARGLVTVKSDRHAETFQAGLRSFVNEARLLAKFDHPSLVKVFRFWESNGTAYMVMPLIEGPTLKQVLQEGRRQPTEDWLKVLLARLAEALSVIHADQCYHRDIAPDNIILVKDDRPVLLDFGAARRVIGDMTQAPTVILKPGYAPYEQYAEMPDLRQGAWTDIYALAAVVYFAVTGRPPIPSVSRVMTDPLEPLAKVAAGRYSAPFLQAVDRALAVKPQDRPQSIDAFAALLDLPSAGSASNARTEARTRSGPSADATIIERVPLPRPPESKSRVGLYATLAGALVAVVVGAIMFMPSGEVPNPTAPSPAVAPPPVAPQAAAPSGPQETKPLPAPPPPITPERAMAEVMARADADLVVNVSVPKPELRIGKDQFAFNVLSRRSGHLYVFMIGTNDRDFVLLFPNQLDRDNRIEAGRLLALPRRSWEFTSDGPAGVNHFYALVSESPREFGGTGLGPMEPIARFPTGDLRPYAERHDGPQPAFAGKPACPSGAACPDRYGIAAFTIAEVQ